MCEGCDDRGVSASAWGQVAGERHVRVAAARATGGRAALRGEVDRGLRARRFLGYRESSHWARTAQPIVDELRLAVERAPSRDLVVLLERAVGHVVKVIPRADDSNGTIGDLAGGVRVDGPQGARRAWPGCPRATQGGRLGALPVSRMGCIYAPFDLDLRHDGFARCRRRYAVMIIDLVTAQVDLRARQRRGDRPAGPARVHPGTRARRPAGRRRRAPAPARRPHPRRPRPPGAADRLRQRAADDVRVDQAGIGYVTPDDQHEGRGPQIRQARRFGMRRARRPRIAHHRAHRQDPT